MAQSRGLSIEEAKESANAGRGNQFKVLPARLLQLLALFLALSISFSFLSAYMVRYYGARTIVTTGQPKFMPCVEDTSGFERWIQPPSVLIHTMSDEELLWRATFAPRIKKYPFRRVPKIAFMFLTKGPMSLAPLWEKFFKGHEGLYTIYIHSLPSFHPGFLSSSVFYRRHIPSQIAEWGRMSMCEAERRLLANALLDISNEYFVLLSESCIPIFNFTATYKHLSKSKHSFIGAFDDSGPFGRGRYSDNMSPEVNLNQWRRGSQWFEVNRKLAITIVEDTTYYPKFEMFCRPACYVDEHYFPTMLAIEAPKLIANRSINWVDWSRGGPHPATFGRADITEEFLRRIREDHHCIYNNQKTSVCFLFARKFAPSTLEPLSKLAPKMLGY